MRLVFFVLTFFLADIIIYAHDIFIPPLQPLFSNQPSENSGRISSYPYISGDSFRSIAQFVIDEMRLPFKPSTVKNGDIIFLKTDLLDYFFNELHPRIPNSYILITHNSDYSAPGIFSGMLDDPKIIRWYAQNADIIHDKLCPIPIGIANRYWPWGNVELLLLVKQNAVHVKKNHLLYANFTQESHSERVLVQHIFTDKSFCYKPGRKPWDRYLLDLAESKFVLSPRGNGLDCHRTWEALIMGSIPIVKSSPIDALYIDLPVIIINDWNEVTQSFLAQKYKELMARSFNDEKKYFSYWNNQILACQKNFIVHSD
jgi:hypothetical protein